MSHRGVERSAREAEKKAKVQRLRVTEPELTQPEIAERVGVTAKTVSRWLREARKQEAA